MTLRIAAIPTTIDIQSTLFDLRRVQASLRTGIESPVFIQGHSILPSAQSASLSGNELTPEHKSTIRKAVRKLLQSSHFVQSNRLSKFLSFVVEMTLEGNGDSLKEYTIGVAAYGRRQDFDPTQDSIVRTEARRLRTKLKEYYQLEGSDDPILIYIRPGSYVPVFQVNETTTHRALQICRSQRTSEPRRLSLFVVPFSHLSGDSFGEACARGLTDEVVHCLTKSQDLRVFTSLSGQAGQATEGGLERKLGAWINFEGNVRTEGNRIRVTSRICDIDGLHIASWRLDAETTPGGLFADLEKIAFEIVTCVKCHDSGAENREASR
jgi:TolB-like protein